MKLHKLHINLVVIVTLSLTIASCDLFELRDRTFDSDPQVEFFPLSRTLTLSQSTSGITTINVQLIGEQRDSDLPLTVSVESSTTTAVEGQHYNLPSTSVNIPAGASTADFDINVTGENLSAGEAVVLVLELQGTDQVRAAPNLRLHTLTLVGEQ